MALAREEDEQDNRFQERKLARSLHRLGLDANEQLRLRAELRERLGYAPSTRDIVWTAAERRFSESMKTADWYELSSVQLFMARLMFEEGRDHLEAARAARRYLLVHYKLLGVAKIEIKTANDRLVCPECQELEGRQIAVEEALREMPLPVKGCSEVLGIGKKGQAAHWCRCGYVRVPLKLGIP